MVRQEIETTAERLESWVAPAGSLNPGEATAMVQSLFYVVGGIWPLLHMRSFTAVTGPKVDLWLTRTVGVLVTGIGAVVGSAGIRGRITREIHLLGAASAAGLAGIDVIYVLRRRISPVYLLDAVAELAIVAGWAFAWMRRTRGNP